MNGDREFRRILREDPCAFYYGELANVLRTKYRKHDMPLTADGVKRLALVGIRAVMHGHVNHQNGQHLSWRHGLLNPLQSIDGVQDILKAIIKGLGKGLLSFRNEEGDIRLAPRGLMTLQVSARREDDLHRLDIHLSWHARLGAKRNRTLKVLNA